MKKTVGMVISILLALSLCACSWLQPLSYNGKVETALEILQSQWREVYAQGLGDGYLEVKNTRVVIPDGQKYPEHFAGVDCIVEFTLFSDYMGAAPYYENAGVYDSVVLFEDGTAQIPSMNLVRAVRAVTYQTDLVKQVVDLGDAYNRTFQLK